MLKCPESQDNLCSLVSKNKTKKEKKRKEKVYSSIFIYSFLSLKTCQNLLSSKQKAWLFAFLGKRLLNRVLLAKIAIEEKIIQFFLSHDYTELFTLIHKISKPCSSFRIIRLKSLMQVCQILCNNHEI